MLGHLVSNAPYGTPVADARPGWLSRLIAFFFRAKT